MNATLRNALGAAALLAAAQAGAQITLYSGEGFHGQAFTTDRPVGNFGNTDFNDRASSVVVNSGRWEVCEDAHFQGRCVTLRRGEYPNLRQLGLDNKISSVREVGREGRGFAPTQSSGPPPQYNSQPPQYNSQPGERLYQANVASVRAVVGPPEQRCWIEREQVVEHRGDASIPGAIAGAVIGGVLGHQIGGGRGKDVATAGGAVGGALIGGNVGRNYGGGDQVIDRDVQRCATANNANRVDYWDVAYYFRGQEHHAQLTNPPGPTILVNEFGEPRA